jgi:2-oxoglutarate ferredoxin oxidoreductase subunit beta
MTTKTEAMPGEAAEVTPAAPTYAKKDFVSGQEIRWCPGCGDYTILSAMQMACTQMGIRRENLCFISGIGCSSRFPYYMNTYGMHSIHGRAPAIATGVKIQNPELSVWVITGDGDSLSIGGNHLIHAIRRNIDINIIIFNNEIYGLTKGQYSPTSQTGIVTKSTPFGSTERPFNPAQLILGAGATFYARTVDNDVKHMQEIFLAAEKHRGTSVVEILQNCVIFNDGVHNKFKDKETKDETTLKLESGMPMIFGKEKNKGIAFRHPSEGPVVVEVTPESDQSQFLVHNPTTPAPYLSQVLSSFVHPAFPIPLGIFRQVEVPTYETKFHQQIKDVSQTQKKERTVKDLLASGDTWVVGENFSV